MPRGRNRLSPEVYRRRRIAAAVILALIIALIWAGVGSFVGWISGGNQPNPDGVAISAGDPCPAGTVFVEAVVGNQAGENLLSFAAEETPYIWFTLTNTNSVDCLFNAGPKVQYFSILSGEQLIWSSKDCDRTGLEDTNITLKADETIASTPQPWEKVFSSSSGCGADQAPVVTGGASYHLKVEVNGELSKNTQQFVLN